jgi:hypothetical protein
MFISRLAVGHFILAVALLVLAACNDGVVATTLPFTKIPVNLPDSVAPVFPTSGSCNTQSVSGFYLDQCVDWSDSSGASDFSHSCTLRGGVFSATSSCVSTLRVGSCVASAVGTINSTFRYYSPTYDITSAQSSCTTYFQGTFTPN